MIQLPRGSLQGAIKAWDILYSVLQNIFALGSWAHGVVAQGPPHHVYLKLQVQGPPVWLNLHLEELMNIVCIELIVFGNVSGMAFHRSYHGSYSERETYAHKLGFHKHA